MESIEAVKNDLKAEIRICYGALSSFQTQLHHLCGVVEESRRLNEEALQDIRDIDRELKIIRENLK